MRIVGVDLGSKFTGIVEAKYSEQNLQEADFRVERFENPVPDKYADVEDVFEDILSTFDPQVIVAENYAYGGGRFFNKEIPELFGIFKMVAHRERIPVILVAPNTARKIVCGNGRATELQIRKSVLEYLEEQKFDVDLTFKDSVHAIDAMAVVIAAMKADLKSTIVRDLTHIGKYYNVNLMKLLSKE